MHHTFFFIWLFLKWCVQQWTLQTDYTCWKIWIPLWLFGAGERILVMLKKPLQMNTNTQICSPTFKHMPKISFSQNTLSLIKVKTQGKRNLGYNSEVEQSNTFVSNFHSKCLIQFPPEDCCYQRSTLLVYNVRRTIYSDFFLDTFPKM